MSENDEELLADLLLQWEELQDRGQDTAAGELCRHHPHLTNELARRIDALKITSWMDRHDTEDGGTTACTPGTDTPRTLAGRYRLDEKIAEGGSAEVWKGFDQELRRTVAVKMPKPGRLHSTERFLAEARRVARLKHPGVVPVFDVGQDAGSCFIISEFVEGGSLADRIATNRPTVQESARMVAEVAETLAYAHCQGFIHRDIKPGNILIDQHGRALLTDFGIAFSPGDTAEGGSFGTLVYMSPEQVEGKPLDHRTDIYSLGVVLKEALTGKLPYSSTEPVVLQREIRAGTKNLDLSGLPVRLKNICRNALEHNPERRYESAADMATELRRCVKDAALRPWLWASLSIMPILACGLILWWSSQYGDGPTRNQASQPQAAEKTEPLPKVVPPEQQLETVVAKLRECNPEFDGRLTGFDGKGLPRIQDGFVTEVGLLTDKVSDLSPLQTLVGLKLLSCRGNFRRRDGKITDLTPLRELRLTRLDVSDNGTLSDLGPLRGMGLETFDCNNTEVSDLSPLEGMALNSLSCFETKVRSLKPLMSMPLKRLDIGDTSVPDLMPLQGMNLVDVRLRRTPVSDLSPLQGMPLACVWCDQSRVSDLSPLEGMSLADIAISPQKITKGLEVIRRMKSIKTIRLSPVQRFTSDEFWRRYDAGEFGKPNGPRGAIGNDGANQPVPGPVDAALALGRLHSNKQEWDQAEAAFTEAIKLDPKCAEAYHRRAGAIYNAGKLKESLPDFDTAARLDPNNAEILKNRSFVYLRLLRVDEALTDLRHAQKLDPDHPELYRKPMSLALAQRGYVKAQANKLEEAIADIGEAIRLDPTNAEFFDKRGSLHFNLKHHKEAVADFTEAIGLDPNRPEFYLHRGFALEALGKKDEAAEDYRKGKKQPASK